MCVLLMITVDDALLGSGEGLLSYGNLLFNQSQFRLCVEVGDHGAPFASVKCLHSALCHARFRHVAHVASPTLSSSSSASFSVPPCPPTLIFVGNDAFLHVHNRPVSFS